VVLWSADGSGQGVEAGERVWPGGPTRVVIRLQALPTVNVLSEGKHRDLAQGESANVDIFGRCPPIDVHVPLLT